MMIIIIIEKESRLIIDKTEIIINPMINQLMFKMKKLIVMVENFKIIIIEIIFDKNEVIRTDQDFNMIIKAIKIGQNMISRLERLKKNHS
jgi:hypothetical protein